MKAKVKIDWDTVELVLPVERAPRVVPDPRGRLIVKQILSGAAQKARSRGALYTHAQLRTRLPTGVDTFAYGLRLAVAAMQSDLSRGIEMAAHAIIETSQRVQRR